MGPLFTSYWAQCVELRSGKCKIKLSMNECRLRHANINGQISLSLGFLDRNCKCQFETDANTAEKETTHPAHV